QRKVLLRAEALPVVRLDARAPLARELDGAVGAAGVDHDALVAERETVEAGADVRLLVLGDHDGAQTRQRISPVKIRPSPSGRASAISHARPDARAGPSAARCRWSNGRAPDRPARPRRRPPRPPRGRPLLPCDSPRP